MPREVLALALVTLVIYAIMAVCAWRSYGQSPGTFEPTPPSTTSSTVAVLTNIQGSITIPMGAWWTNNIAGANLSLASFEQPTNTGDCFGFADAVTNVCRVRAALPWDWDLGQVLVSVQAFCSGTNASQANQTNIVFAARAAAIGNTDDNSTPSFGSLVLTTNGISTNKFIAHTAITTGLTVGNSPAAGKSILWELQRLGAAAGDTETNSSVYVSEVILYFSRTLTTTGPVSTP